MNVLLINADAKFNLAIRKLYRFYKESGHKIKLMDLELSYYENDKRYINCDGFEYVYVSCIFENTLNRIIFYNIDHVENFDIGGIGTEQYKRVLPPEIDKLEPYYFKDEKVSYNFITRGCIRNCYFCKVRPSEGYIRLNKHPKDMILLDKTEFLDNNILALPDHNLILKWIVDSNIKMRFNQGLDFRLTNNENLKLLSECNYEKEYIFAFDDISYMNMIKSKLPLIKTYISEPFKTKWYVYINYNMPLKDTIERVKYLIDNECLPYIMRDKNCYIKKDDKCNFFKDLSAYCNQPQFLKKMTFEQFMDKRTKNKERVEQSIKLWNSV